MIKMRRAQLSFGDGLIAEKYGAGILQELRKLYRTPKRWTREELLAIQKSVAI